MAQLPDTASPPEATILSVRIVSLDYYMAPPIPDLDICYSAFHGRSVKEVPVIRIYGSTPAGQKACLHIHRALPFLYIHFPAELLQSSKEGDEYIKALMTTMEKTLNQNVSSAKKQRVHGYNLVRAKKIYGYHSSEDFFLKIYLYYPHDVARTATMLLDGAVFGRTFQPYESHIPYLLHFLVDYNLYGMGHLHTSKIKFRPPLPDSFLQKADKGQEAVGDSAIWLSSTVPSSLVWPDSVFSQLFSERSSISIPKRQSICELEGDSSVDDILNEKNKTFTSLSQSRPEVKMVQSLIPIWEEFEQSGILEVAKPLELSRPHPQHVLKKFLLGLHCENALSESFLKMYKSLPENVLAFEDDEKLEEHIKLLAGIYEKFEFVECKQGNNSFSEPVNDYEVNNKTDMFHGLQSDEKEDTLLCEKISEFHDLASGKRNFPTPIRNIDEKTLTTEALGLLSWFTSSQAADEFNAQDELVQEAILTPLYSINSYKKALEIAHLDYEHASQQECEDILDSVECACKTDVVKEHNSHGGYHEQGLAASSGEMIHQADGSLDGKFGTYTKHNSERSANSRQLNLFKDKDTFVMNRNGKYRRRDTLLGPLPFSTTQKDHTYSEPYFSTDESLENDENCHASYANAETSGKKLEKPLASCSVRDLMRQKRHFRAGYNEPERISVDVLPEALHNKKKSLCLENSPSCAMPIMSNAGSSCVGHENSAQPAKCLLGQFPSHADECIVRQDDIHYLSKCDVQNARENCHDAGGSSHAESANMQLKNYCGTVGSSASNVNQTMLITSKVEKTFMEFVERSFTQKAPSKDQIVHILEDSPDATGNPTEAHSEAIHFDSCCMNTDLRGMDDLLPFFTRDYEHRTPYQPPNDVEGCELLQESALGIPTHFQNDGSVLYLLSHATSPPSADSVCQWLLDVEQGGCSNNTIDNSNGNLQTSQGSSLKLQGRYEHVDKEINYCLHEIAKDKPLLTRGNTQSPLVESRIHTVTSFAEPKLSSIFTGEVVPDSSWQDISQISGPDDKSNLTPLSQIGFRDPASIGGGQQLTLMSVEAQTESRGNLLPDPKFDRINVISLTVQEDNSPMLAVYVLIRGVNDEPQRNKDGLTGCNISIFNEEKHLLRQFVKIISSVDPDILMGWEIQGGSLGFIAERAGHLGICLLKSISRTPDNVLKPRIGDADNSKLDTEISESSIAIANTGLQDATVHDELGYALNNGIHVSGRIVLNIWRLMRSEVKLNMYSIEAVAEAVLRRKIPSFSCKVLNHWFSKGPGRSRSRCIEYLIERTKLNLEIMNQMDMINRTSELARVFGIDFYSVLSRGSQFRVESMLLRLAHTQNYLAISPGNQQVALQPAMECLPLVMEPESNFYEDPVVVLDFQSLYPSMIIAYNLCFSTCLGKVVPSKSNVLGVSSYSADPHIFKDLSELLLLAPNGVMYAPSKIRKGVLPRLLEELLSTRIMIKQAIKKLKPSQQVLERIFNARQLALKLIANVTYGYTAAGFSGRMPCAELADSIVQCGRRTLEEAISFVNKHPRWKARVIYGDTDSMFVLLKGRNKEAAFRIGNEIASAITSMNPDPVTLKLEKVYQPCFLLTKKRYVGYSYERPDQENPNFDAKGIETVRRDMCPAVAKILEKSIRLIFEHRDILKVKSYLQRQWTRILSGRVSLQDFIFAKEVHLGTYSTRMSSLPPAAIVATKAMNADPRSEPHYGQRVPYVVVHGEPGARLADMVVDPHDLIEINSPYRLNDLYYIKKQIIPALQRVFGLLGADLNQWFLEMPHSIRPVLALARFGSSHDFDYNGQEYTRKAQVKSRIDTYYSSKHCVICGDLVHRSKYLCDICLEKKPLIATAIVGKTSRLERDIQHLAAICRHCGGGDSFPGSGVPCNSLACSIFYERRKVQKELQANSVFAAEVGLYPTCVTEWF